ncbi:hypothetical protein D3C76_669620 [compost metagenome]
MQMTIVMTSDIESLFASGPLCQAGFINIRLNRISAPACNESGLDPASAFQQPGQNHQPMKVLIYSDLHIEFKPFDPPDVEADLVVLAGDISVQKKAFCGQTRPSRLQSSTALGTMSVTKVISIEQSKR